mmetsp:Transcript_19049/g.49166  ORF Transcript_19049/g.49166 Transcript_19049/m.49166 type:complete len:109 (-) Transcript_19049:429-755(-)|eukprot:CAMPEP_0119432024 /NCGR_PEP_ID=MMETSP1335-20130426/47021_1 /TAXON_ID=259385 /ORGANISM="Chrysoculter rhomboideus, Strain RCC1486" /LENGTH=108 /DNA_ID=CAMNT_0007457835 /DNA_START=72 /DNA_END=398 /DNA_ORIENTATION=-
MTFSHDLAHHPEWAGHMAKQPEADFCGLKLDGASCFNNSFNLVSCNFGLPELRAALQASASAAGWTLTPQEAGDDAGAVTLSSADKGTIIARYHDLPEFGMSVVQAVC